MPQILPPPSRKKSALQGTLEGLGAVGETVGHIHRLNRATAPNSSAEDILKAPKSEAWKKLALEARNTKLQHSIASEEFFSSLPSGGQPLTEAQISRGHALDPKRMAAIVKAREPEQKAYLKREEFRLKKADSAIEDISRNHDEIEQLDNMQKLLESPTFKKAGLIGFRDALESSFPFTRGWLAGATTENQIFEKGIAQFLGPELRGLVKNGGAKLFRPEIDTILKALPSLHNSKEANLSLIKSLKTMREKANVANQIYADLLAEGESFGEKDFALKFKKRLDEALADFSEERAVHQIELPDGSSFKGTRAELERLKSLLGNEEL
jgi:hypothetical protein